MENTNCLVIIHSHGTHRLNSRRLLSQVKEFEGHRLIFIGRVFSPPSWLSVKNHLKKVVGNPETFLVSRASENGIIDGYSGRVVSRNVRLITSLIPDITTVVIGELAGEVSLLGNLLAEETGAHLCLVPEGTGVLFEDATAAGNRGVGWKLALERSRFQRQLRGLKRRGRDSLPVTSIRSIQKLWWRVRRQVFLRIRRPGPPALSSPTHLDYMVSDWAEHVPKGISAARTINPTRRSFRVQSAHHEDILFLHAPYDFSAETWLSCLEAIASRETGLIVLKRHRIPTGFANLVEAANSLKEKANVRLVERGVVEDMFAQRPYRLVAGVDSTALFSVQSFLPDCPSISVLDTIEKTVKGNEVQIVKKHEDDWKLFRNRCVGRVKVV